MEITAGDLRNVLGHLPTGVVVVAADGPAGPAGMAVNSITSLSLDPPLILLCPARSSQTWPVIRQARSFCVSIIGKTGRELAHRFAIRGIDRFADLAVLQRPCGPGIPGAVAWIDCQLRDEYDGGDHTVAIADVLHTEVAAENAPLVFFRGKYGTFASSEED